MSGLLLSSWSEGDGHEEGRSKHSLRSWGWVILLCCGCLFISPLKVFLEKSVLGLCMDEIGCYA